MLRIVLCCRSCFAVTRIPCRLERAIIWNNCIESAPNRNKSIVAPTRGMRNTSAQIAASRSSVGVAGATNSSALCGIQLRSRQGSTIKFAVRRHRQLVEFRPRRGDHVVGQLLLDRGAQIGRSRPAGGCCDVIGDQSWGSGRIFPQQHGDSGRICRCAAARLRFRRARCENPAASPDGPCARESECCHPEANARDHDGTIAAAKGFLTKRPADNPAFR